MSDIEIARAAKKIHIRDVAAKVNIPEENLIPYGHDAAKINFDFIEKSQSNPDGKLILVTAINPTPAGEGKTTTSVGLNDGLNKIGKKSIVCLREPSLGPCFGMRVALLEADMIKLCQWKKLIFTSPVTFTQSQLLTVYYHH